MTATTRRKKKSDDSISDSGIYFKNEQPVLEFFSTGCEVLNCMITGHYPVYSGYPIGRIVNIVGNKSVGKTLLGIEAMPNFLNKYPSGSIYYHEGESAFDIDYAAGLGMPVDKVNFVNRENDKNTVESMYECIHTIVERSPDEPSLYIIDSLDSLSDAAELERDITDSTYGSNKAKKLSEMFRRLTGDISQSKMCFMVISQVRDNIGVSFGEKKKRSGGMALDFYASAVIWLAEIEKIQKTINKVKRPIGIWDAAKCKKNKLSMPFRTCEFPIIFGYGMDDAWASLEWLKSVDMLEELEIEPKKILEVVSEINTTNNVEMKQKIAEYTRKIWQEIEVGFTPAYKKY